MAKSVFISHAGADTAKADVVVRHLAECGVTVRFDRLEIGAGDNFLDFMENSIASADYCLLLWSSNAARATWVRLEWQAALYRSIQESRSFLMIGRLEDVPVPALLGPRLNVDLFPDLQPGLDQIIRTWESDRGVEARTARRVAAVPATNEWSNNVSTIYVTSDQFGVTVPLKVDLQEPAGVCLDRIIRALGLPKVFDHEGRLGVRFEYRLMHAEQPLARGSPMISQDIKENSVLWLETTMIPFSHSEVLRGHLGAAVFRDLETLDEKDEAGIYRLAVEEFQSAVLRNGLGGDRLPVVPT